MHQGLSEAGGAAPILPASVLFKGNLIAIIGILLSVLVLTFPSPGFAQSPLSDFNPAVLIDSPNIIFFDGRTFWADNALPLRAIFFDKWGGPFNPDTTNSSDNYWKTGAGLVHNGWRLAGYYRGELFMTANKDTIEILRMVNRKEELTEARVFEIDLKTDGFSAAGFELSKGIDLNKVTKGLSSGVTARYLRGEKIQNGSITGTVTSTGPMTYDFDFSLDYLYDENLVYDRRDTISGTGNGYSLDLGVRYLINERLSAEVLLRDIGGRIYWRDVPYTTANATSDIKSYDEEGYQVYRPTIQGYEGYRDFTQEIPLKTDISLSYQKGVVALTPTVNFIEGRPLYWIDMEYIVSNDIHMLIGYNANYHAVSAGMVYRKTSFNIWLNDIDLYRTSAIGLALSIWY